MSSCTQEKSRGGDLTGKVFTRLTVLSKHPEKAPDGHTKWLCRCSCGAEKAIPRNYLTKGSAKSCGCLFKEQAAEYGRKHGMHGTSFYGVWQGLFARCYRPSHRSYKNYGAKGITVCDRWSSFDNFYEDMYAGYMHGLDIDRMDSKGNYEPSNCKWSTRVENAQNRSTTKLTVEDAGCIKSLCAMLTTNSIKWIAKEFGVSTSVICGIRNGTAWPNANNLIAY